MAGRVEAAGVALAYEEHGAGEPVLLVHGVATDRAIWRETVAELGGELRAIAYDRRGYGDSDAPEPYGGTTVGEQADDAAALLRGIDAAPALVCGQGLGAIVCLDLLVREPELVRGAVLVNPPVLWLDPDGPEAVAEMREAVERGVREGGGAGAVDAFLDHEGAALDGDRLAAARAAVRPFAVDLGAAPTWPASRRELQAIAAPAIVLAGVRGPEIVRRVARSLADLLPRAELREPDAGPLAQVDAAGEVAAAIRAVGSV